MRKITDIYNYLDDRELNVECPDWEKSVLACEEKERILQKALEKIREEGNAENGSAKNTHRLGGRKKIGLLVLAAVFLMGLTASAAEYFHLNDNLLEFLGIHSEDAEKELESMSTDLSRSENRFQRREDEQHGVRICAGQMASDGETVYICFDIELPEGIFMDSDEEVKRIMKFRESLYSIGDLQDEGIGEMIIQKNKNTPDRYYAIAELEADILSMDEQDSRLSMTFRDLGYIEADDNSTNWVELISGEWMLTWQMECKNTFRNYAVSEILTFESGTIEIQGVRLSPFSVTLSGAVLDGDSVLDDLTGMDGVITEDGFCREVFRVQRIDSEDGKFILKGTFRDMEDMENILGVKLNGADILLKK